MSRNRREKNPHLTCGFNWPADGGGCDHSCHLLLAEHGDTHRCCAAPDGHYAEASNG